jgi:hypothetical protein
MPATRRAVFEKIKHLEAAKCPFANLPGLSMTDGEPVLPQRR